jgi:transketolase
MSTTFDLRALVRRTAEIDYRYKHRHLPSSISALPIIAEIYAEAAPGDRFVLSKGHACAALYAVLEALGKSPDVSKVHPDRDEANGIEVTSGSLGHGLPLAAGMAHGIKLCGAPHVVHVLLGDGECAEGTTWETLVVARRLGLQSHLSVHVDCNGRQGSEALLCPAHSFIRELYPVSLHTGNEALTPRLLREHPDWIVHTLTEAEYMGIVEEFA